jgi:CheY-like chemotaxis protein
MLGKKRVLIVDDEATLANIVKMNLEKTGRYEVRTENKGKQAVNTAKAFMPDVILLDMVMPDMMGSKVAEEMKKDSYLGRLPIGFMTALVNDDDVEQGRGTVGGYPCIAKPATTDKLVAFIESLSGSY